MRFEGFEVPADKMTDAVDELRAEREATMEWFEKSVDSITALRRSFKGEGDLTKDEIKAIANDLLIAGLLLAASAARTKEVIEVADSHVAAEETPEMVKNLEKYLKEHL